MLDRFYRLHVKKFLGNVACLGTKKTHMDSWMKAKYDLGGVTAQGLRN